MNGRDTEFGRFHAEEGGACRVSEESAVDEILATECTYLNL